MGRIFALAGLAGLALVLALGGPGMAAGILPPGLQQFQDENGAPLSGCKVYTYIPNTSTLKQTWQDPLQSTPNSNPVLCDSAGRVNIWGSGQYTELLRDQFGNIVWNKLTAQSGASNTYFVLVNKAIGSPTSVPLPGSPNLGDSYNVKDGKGDSATNPITIAPAAGSGQLIDGQATLVISQNFEAVAVTWNGVQWNATTSYQQAGVSSSQPGYAKMWPNPGQQSGAANPWQAVDPWGNSISCAGTNTQCLQEFINAAAAAGWPARVFCQGTNSAGQENVFIQANSTVNVPAVQNWFFQADGCNLNLGLTAVPGLVLNSEGSSQFIWNGIIVYNITSPISAPPNASCAVSFAPKTQTPNDHIVSIYDGTVSIKAVVTNVKGSGNPAAAVCFDGTGGGQTTSMNLNFGEILAQGAVSGVLAFGATAPGQGISNNLISINHLHGTFTTAGVQEGISTDTNDGDYGVNQWTIGTITNDGTASFVGVDTYGTHDLWTISGINAGSGGEATTGVKFDTNATFNTVQLGVFNGGGGVASNFTATNSLTGAAGVTAASSGFSFLNGSSLLMNWGSGTAATGGGTTTTFAHAFPNACLQVTATVLNANSAVQASCSTTGVTLIVPSGTPNVSFMAVGD